MSRMVCIPIYDLAIKPQQKAGHVLTPLGSIVLGQSDFNGRPAGHPQSCPKPDNGAKTTALNRIDASRTLPRLTTPKLAACLLQTVMLDSHLAAKMMIVSHPVVYER